MSFFQQRVADLRLMAIADMTANLKAQMHELNRLRDRLSKARLSDRRSRFLAVQRQRSECRNQWPCGIVSLCGSDKRPVTYAQKPPATYLPKMSQADEVHADQKRRSQIPLH